MSTKETGTIIELPAIKAACKDCSLRELCLPLGLSENDLQSLDKIINRRRRLKKGEHLYRMGDSMQSLYAIKSGSLKTVELMADGRSQVTGFHLPGELLGIDAISSSIHPCSAEALETADLCEMPLVKVEALAREIPGLQHQLFRLMSGQIRQDETLMLMLGKMTAEERLASFLVNLQRRLSRLGVAGDHIRLSMSRQDMGDYLGLALETVSRLFSRFQDEGYLSVQGRHLQLLNIQALTRLGQGAGHDDAARRGHKA